VRVSFLGRGLHFGWASSELFDRYPARCRDPRIIRSFTIRAYVGGTKRWRFGWHIRR
jgi:hypothetical protein